MACLNRTRAAQPRNEISELRCSGDEPIACRRLTLVLFATTNDEEGAVMTNRNAARSTDRFTMGRVAYVVERFSLAVTGALCGLFVAAHLAKANVDVFDSVGLVFAMIRFGIIGFRIGNDVPAFLPGHPGSAFQTLATVRESMSLNCSGPPAHFWPPWRRWFRCMSWCLTKFCPPFG